MHTQNQNSGIQDTAQLDLALAARNAAVALAFRRPAYRRRQMLRARAQWWFEQMRRVVDSAVEWKPATPARPEQTAFDLRRDTEVMVTK